jgi:predicted Zn-dependent peptidase
MEDVKAFFKEHYNPSNAVLVVAGDVEVEQVKALAEKWFEPIDAGMKPKRNLPVEPPQTEYRSLTVERDVPISSIYRAYRMCARTDEEYHTVDLLSDILSRGNSSRLYKNLIKDKQLFSDINAYVMGDFDKGLFVISGKINDGVTIEQAEAGIDAEIAKMQNELVAADELQKCKNKVESTVTYSEADVLNKATNLAISELLGDANLINLEIENYQNVTAEQIKEQANIILRKTNCSTLFYLKKK